MARDHQHPSPDQALIGGTELRDESALVAEDVGEPLEERMVQDGDPVGDGAAVVQRVDDGLDEFGLAQTRWSSRSRARAPS